MAKPVVSKAQALPGLIVYRFTHSLYYANAEQFATEVTALVNDADPPVRWLCLEASAVDDVDYSAAETLRSVFALLRDKGVRLVITQVLDDVKETSRYNLRDLFGEDAFYERLHDVIDDYKKQFT